jgi:perosamine synthetase
VVDLYGYPAVTESLQELCQKEGLFIIEDAPQALGSSRNGRSVGSVSKATIFSFFESKHLSIGEGGMITTNDEQLASRFRMIRSHGQDRPYHQVMLGYNFRLPVKLARDGLSGLSSIDRLIRRRVRIAHVYDEILADTKSLHLPIHEKAVSHSYYRFPLVLKLSISKVKGILKRTSEAMRLSIGGGYNALVYQQPFYRSIHKLFWGAKVVPFPDYSKWHCPSAEYAVHRIIELPTDPGISEEKASRVAFSLRKFIKEVH